MKKPFLTFKDVQAIVSVSLLGLILAAGLLAVNWWAAGRYGAGADFLPAWNGARAFYFERTDPYSRTVAERTQAEVYGRAAHAGEFPYALDIPFPLLLLFFPFALIPDPVWARAAWMTLSEFGLFLLVTHALRLADWRPVRWFGWFLLAFALAWFYSLTALQDASLSLLLIAALVGALTALRSLNDEMAGFLLAIAAMKWEVTLLLWLFIFVGAFVSRRWRVFAGFLMMSAVLGGLTLIVSPNWIWPYLRAVVANLHAGHTLTPVFFLRQWFPEFGARIAQVFVVLLLVVLLFEWAGAFRARDFRRVAWAAALSLAITPLLGLSTTYGNLAPLAFSFVLILPFAWERWEKQPYLILSLIVALFFALPFFLRWPIIAARLPADGLAFLLPPLLIILGLYWVRWYVVRPPLTWLDGVKRELRK